MRRARRGRDADGMRALIVDPRSARASLAAARALARAGWSVGVGGMDPKSLAASSRSCRWWHRVPPPEAGLDRFAAAVEHAVRGCRYAVVFPSGDAEALALSSERSRIGARVPYPADAVVVRAFDKHWLARAAAEAGIAVPMTVLVGRGSPPPPFSPPMIVKERVHAGGQCPGSERFEALLATTQSDAAARVREIHAKGNEAILQEVVRGRLMSFAAVTGHDGKVMAAVQQEAERIFPTEAGASVRARTVPPHPEVEQRAARLLQGMEWSGSRSCSSCVRTAARPSSSTSTGASTARSGSRWLRGRTCRRSGPPSRPGAQPGRSRPSERACATNGSKVTSVSRPQRIVAISCTEYWIA